MRLHAALLRRPNLDVALAVRGISGRVGQGRMPRSLEPLRDRLQQAAGGEPPRPVAPDVLHELVDIFAEVEAPTSALPIPGEEEAIHVPPPDTADVPLLEVIRTELRTLRERHERLLVDCNLEHLRLMAAGPRADAVTSGRRGRGIEPESSMGRACRRRVRPRTVMSRHPRVSGVQRVQRVAREPSMARTWNDWPAAS
ncbi:hypothetical protein OV203_01905 [Nannocystis sp. ILAH1]|uniref:hypothetical protein n=1 Tax=Nannocystis sp. ILAH1 TaxID=2996789 RepID=UPI002271DD14|nr:hypothetical protein [Nannocystis sp. ILAH1]MCY0985866.1 hypothetical protein [Nannocystis sp. ILAH1]